MAARIAANKDIEAQRRLDAQIKANQTKRRNRRYGGHHKKKADVT